MHSTNIKCTGYHQVSKMSKKNEVLANFPRKMDPAQRTTVAASPVESFPEFSVTVTLSLGEVPVSETWRLVK
jgi:hypothetical protein